MSNTVSPADVLEAAAMHMRERADTYDQPDGERSMMKTVEMFNTLVRGNDHYMYMTTEQGWLFMAILKIVRSQQGAFKLDNYEDLAAYAALAAEEAADARQDK